MKKATGSANGVRVVQKKKSRFREIWGRFKKNKTAIVGLILFSIVLLMVIFADVLVPYSASIEQNIPVRLQGPSAEHIMGTDSFGRDIFARLVHGSRNSLLVGIGAVFIGMVIGGILGAVSGYYGGKIDNIIVRITDMVMCIPMMLLVLTLVAALGSSLMNVLLAMMISNIPGYTRVVRSAVLTVVDQDYIEAAHSCGTPNRWIIFKHIIPNAIGPIIVQTTMSIGSMILNAAAISFLGMGIQPPTPEWGAMLNEARNFMIECPYMVFFPGAAIGITALGLNLMGDGLRDALDPKLKD